MPSTSERTIIRLAACVQSDTEQSFAHQLEPAAARRANNEAEGTAEASPTSSDTEQVRVRKSDWEVRSSPPHRTHQVYALFLGIYVIMLYRKWVVLGLCGYFHAFLCKFLKFL